MNKFSFILSAAVYTLNCIITHLFKIDTQNTLWSGLFFLILSVLLCIGCTVNALNYKKHNAVLGILFHSLSFVCSFGIVLIAVISPFLLKNINSCLIMSAVFLFADFIMVIGLMLANKKNYRYKTVFKYFSLLFSASLILLSILTFVFVL